MGQHSARRVSVAAVLAAGCLFGTAATAGTTGPDPSEPAATEAEQRGERALASLQYPWRQLGYAVEFRDYEGGTLGTASSRTKRIVIYVKRDHAHQPLRVTIAHELGHALDFEHATAERRQDYRAIRDLSQSARWYPCSGCRDYASHAGDWAEVFASWLAGPGDFRSEVAGPPDDEQLRRLGPLFQVPKAQAAPKATASPKPSSTASPRPSAAPGSLVPTLQPAAARTG